MAFAFLCSTHQRSRDELECLEKACEVAWPEDFNLLCCTLHAAVPHLQQRDTAGMHAVEAPACPCRGCAQLEIRQSPGTICTCTSSQFANAHTSANGLQGASRFL